MTFQIVTQNQSGELVTTSLAIADGTENDHASVIRLVRTYLDDLQEFGGVGFEIDSFDTAGGTQAREVAVLNEQQSTLLITYMRNNEIVRKFKKALVKAFYELKQAAKPVGLSTLEILAIAMKSEKVRLLAIEQRDHAIATKAHIGSRREVTAMVTASKAVREAAKLRDELGRNQRHATIIAVEKATGAKFGTQGFRPLQKWCKANDVTPEKVPCPRYGKAASWPASAWADCYDISLVDLFGEVA